MSSEDVQAQSHWKLMLGAIGVVFGDIGTSPLYTLKEAFGHAYGLHPTDGNVLGILSLVFWSLTLIVTLKYVAVVMRADNRGEGGIMSLMALVQRNLPVASEVGYTAGLLGIFGASLFFGDAVITPAISVLSAVEGLEVVAPGLHSWIVPVTIAVLVPLFAVQRGGTDRVGKVFGPITALWFIALAFWGALAIIETPRVLMAISPVPAVEFVVHHATHAFFVLGAVVLCVTGAEALYADMGHFGKRPIQHAWIAFVFPALILNYFGQGALLLDHPSAASNPFFRMLPSWALLPMIGLATAATVIASQAVISGAFSLARQAMQLGYLPRMDVIHTSETTIGQVYLPWINRLLLAVVIALVLGFGSSTALASAYGVAVTGTMTITTILLYMTASTLWRRSGLLLDLVFLALLAVDLAFLGANLVKFFDGAWFPLALGVLVFVVMRTWWRGRQLLAKSRERSGTDRAHFLQDILRNPPHRVDGTAVFLTSEVGSVPLALLHNLKHNKVLHERNVFLTIKPLSVPFARAEERADVIALAPGFFAVRLGFGFLDELDIPAVFRRGEVPGVSLDPERTTWFASREIIVANPRIGMAGWRDKLFVFMQRNATPATESFRVPGSRLVELGTHVEI